MQSDIVSSLTGTCDPVQDEKLSEFLQWERRPTHEENVRHVHLCGRFGRQAFTLGHMILLAGPKRLVWRRSPYVLECQGSFPCSLRAPHSCVPLRLI